MNQQTRQLPNLARWYCTIFPWYKQLLAERRLTPESPTRELPLITNELLGASYYSDLNDHFPHSTMYMTSGTATGVRKRVLYSSSDEEAYVRFRREVIGDFLRPLARGSVVVSDLGIGHCAETARRIVTALGFISHGIDYTRPLREHIALLNEWRPAALFTMPIILDRLLETPGALTISLAKVIVVGDVASRNWRRDVAARLGIAADDILDLYGSSEMGAIAAYCPRTGLYHFHDHLLPEVISTSAALDGTDAVCGQESSTSGDGILVLTSFQRDYFPALRYVMHDVITGLRQIEWRGRAVYAFERIEGRCGGDFKHGERVSYHDICDAVGEVFPGCAFNVQNTGGLVIEIGAESVLPGQKEALLMALVKRVPDVRQMIDSGLVGEILIRGTGQPTSPRTAKRVLRPA